MGGSENVSIVRQRKSDASYILFVLKAICPLQNNTIFVVLKLLLSISSLSLFFDMIKDLLLRIDNS